MLSCSARRSCAGLLPRRDARAGSSHGAAQDDGLLAALVLDQGGGDGGDTRQVAAGAADMRKPSGPSRKRCRTGPPGSGVLSMTC